MEEILPLCKISFYLTSMLKCHVKLQKQNDFMLNLPNNCPIQISNSFQFTLKLCRIFSYFHIFMSAYSYCNFLALCCMHSLRIISYRSSYSCLQPLSSNTFSIYISLFIHFSKQSTFSCFYQIHWQKNTSHSILQYSVKKDYN